jgi:hypothetical protein
LRLLTGWKPIPQDTLQQVLSDCPNGGLGSVADTDLAKEVPDR